MVSIVYQNIRGLKSKVDSVQELVDVCQPNLLGLSDIVKHELRVMSYELLVTI